MEHYKSVIGAVALPHIGGLIGAYVNRNEINTWYKNLRRPTWTPPNYIFGPTWTTLYTGMGYASYLVWRDGGGFDGEAKLPLMLYGANLALNWAWSPIFFKLHKKGLAMVEIVCLWGTVGACIVMFHPINKAASYLMIPYLAWLSLASALNYRLWKDNKDKND